MDEKDIRILKILLSEFQPSCRRIAQEMNITSSAAHKRMRGVFAKTPFQGIGIKPEPAFFNSLKVVLLGRIGNKAHNNALSFLIRSPCTLRIFLLGGEEILVYAVIPDISSMEDYVQSIKIKHILDEVQVGILKPPTFETRSSDRKATYLNTSVNRKNMAILSALNDNIFLRPSEVSSVLPFKISPRTVSRRIKDILTKNAGKVSLIFKESAWTCAEGVIALFRLDTRLGRDRRYDEEPDERRWQVRTGAREHNLARLINGTMNSELRHIENKYIVLEELEFTNLLELNFLITYCIDFGIAQILKKELERKTGRRCTLNFAWSVRECRTWLDKTIARKASEEQSLFPLRHDIEEDTFYKKKKILHLFERENQITIYSRALEQALEDGIITEDEEAILSVLRESLKISPELNQQLIETIKAGKKDEGQEK